MQGRNSFARGPQWPRAAAHKEFSTDCQMRPSGDVHLPGLGVSIERIHNSHDRGIAKAWSSTLATVGPVVALVDDSVIGELDYLMKPD